MKTQNITFCRLGGMRWLSLLCTVAVAAFSAVSTQAYNTSGMVGMGEGKDSVPLLRITNFGLKVLDIDLVDGEWPDAEYVRGPEGTWGKSIANPTKVPGRMRMLQGNQVLYDTGEYEDGVSGMTLRIRGNSSAWYDKKPYKIKLQKKADLLLRTDSTTDYRDKNWVLICDETLHTMLGYEVGRLLGMKWTPGYEYVNVVINNRYEGIYLLIENVRRNTDCRLNVSSEGYIFEHDPYWWNEPLWLPSLNYYPLKFTFKYPEVEDFTAADSVYMTDLTYRLERSYSRDYYTQILDVTSWARWCLAHDIMGTRDTAGANRYFTKYDKSDTTLVEMPVLWDFDTSNGDSLAWSKPHIYFFGSLLNNADPTFAETYVAEWERVKPVLYEYIDSVFSSTRMSRYGTGISLSLQQNNARWGTQYMVYSSFYLRPEWIQHRIPWLSREIPKFINSHITGDIDGDGDIDIEDLNIMINIILDNESADLSIADLDDSGIIDVGDLNKLIDLIISQ